MQKLQLCYHKPSNTRSQKKLAEARKDSFLDFSEGACLADTLILDSYSPELRETKFLLFSTTKFVIISYGSLRKLRLRYDPGEGGGSKANFENLGFHPGPFWT